MRHAICGLSVLVFGCSSPQSPGKPPIDRPCLCPVIDAGVRDAGPVPVDGRVPIDARPPVDGRVAVDAPPPVDASVPVDAAAPPDAPPIPPPPVPTGHPRIMISSQGARLKAALAAGTTPATRWRTAVNTWLSGGDLWGFGNWNGALLGALTGDARYCVKAVANVDKQVSDAEIRISAGAAPVVAGDSYLEIGGMIGDLALVYDWCNGSTSPGQRARWIAYANQAVWNVWNYKVATWGGKVFPWTGWSVNNPSNNYYYSFTRATMLLGLATKDENAKAAEWLTMFRDTKILGQLIPQFERDHPDGGSREGTGYGVAMRNLFELYALWEWSTGERLADRTAHTRASIPTFMHQVVPTLDRVAPTGDLSRDSTAAFFDYHRAYLLELMSLYPADPVSARAAALLAASTVPQMASGFMLSYDFVYAPTMAPVSIDLPLVRYARGIGQIYARTSWAKTATWLNLIAGPFTESHAHEDQGSILLYKGVWLAPDAVIWSKGGIADIASSPVGTTRAHSLVRIDAAGTPIRQRNGSTSQVLALHTGPGYLFASLDLSKAYAGTAVSMVRRQVLWLQPDVVVIQDRVVSSDSTSQTWQLVVPKAPTIAGAVASIAAGEHTLTVTRVQPASGSWLSYDFRGASDMTGGWRLDQVQPGGDRTYVTVIGIDGATSPATSTVVFSDVGCTFTLGGKVVTMTAGIDAL